ncbi:hypothetical protein MLD38_022423 [Melastoma candidum]|uniref:Uncharacterized protein n=1 Tax=Melastoma candidum TaxID=119954 RepID=A0ACB9QJR8_9MYRT|nr:hypothetical protein MLD38_022423 [Melastoma candidum]
MADVRRSRDAALGRCRKHPWHHQSPGVCSLCLVERLSRLSSSSSYGKKPSYRMARSASSSSPSSVSTYYSSSESSYCPSPSRRPRHGGRLADEARSGPLMLSALFFGGGRDVAGLKKSRSMAVEAVPKVDKAGEDEKKNKKKNGKGKESRGFWSKLLVNRRRKKRRETDDNNKGLKRSGSATVRETVTT